eukprot:TRINITY_DN94129_c0_g1_i1.p1 TRINITY_DN94129_c0_g1~~TRINITY_DN94129_c0_g1_i1.p1  ORF type:complete len:169 (-),score=13.86 TRINITY_DN94129_c0_g1_i1:295-801(-)
MSPAVSGFVGRTVGFWRRRMEVPFFVEWDSFMKEDDPLRKCHNAALTAGMDTSSIQVKLRGNQVEAATAAMAEVKREYQQRVGPFGACNNLWKEAKLYLPNGEEAPYASPDMLRAYGGRLSLARKHQFMRVESRLVHELGQLKRTLGQVMYGLAALGLAVVIQQIRNK